MSFSQECAWRQWGLYYYFSPLYVHSDLEPSQWWMPEIFFTDLKFNPFDTAPMAKIAVKMSIMRVVKFMSSPGNDFTSWQKCQQLLFGG